ncbi:DoxX family protein [Paenisporosarcina sp. OV554]|uniref:DoxX family protein n=1 Tax=Paenisporosarcina sp. OV554 TaxID=2135694 RepID=UPI000D3576AB|nr:DoxX family protein [Paenisporosarcina sp. OV554]PUB11971.1 putative membrane protein YphA (DoxX/SURF4 family) [Paenisporosarcina sp. OV554]
MYKKELGALIVRVVLGVIFAVHGIVKFQDGISNTVGWFESIGLPGFLAYGVASVEIIGGLLLIIGLATRIVAGVFLLLLVGAIITVKLAVGFVNGYEFDLALMAMAAFLAMAGSELFAVDNRINPIENKIV